MIKKCPKCEGEKVKKNGKKRGKQNYKCMICNHSFLSKKRIKMSQKKVLICINGMQIENKH